MNKDGPDSNSAQALGEAFIDSLTANKPPKAPPDYSAARAYKCFACDIWYLIDLGPAGEHAQIPEHLREQYCSSFCYQEFEGYLKTQIADAVARGLITEEQAHASEEPLIARAESYASNSKTWSNISSFIDQLKVSSKKEE